MIRTFNKTQFLSVIGILLFTSFGLQATAATNDLLPEDKIIFGGEEPGSETVIFGGEEDNTPSQGSLQNPIKQNTINDFFKKFLDIIVQITFPFVVLAVIYTGFLFLKAQGKPEELEKAKRALFWTIVGALIVLGASAIADLIGSTVDDIRA